MLQCCNATPCSVTEGGVVAVHGPRRVRPPNVEESKSRRHRRAPCRCRCPEVWGGEFLRVPAGPAKGDWEKLREIERDGKIMKDHERSFKIVELRHGLQGVWEFIHITKLEEYNVHFGIHVTQCSADSSAGTASCWLESQQRTCTGALHVSRTQEVIFTDVYRCKIYSVYLIIFNLYILYVFPWYKHVRIFI